MPISMTDEPPFALRDLLGLPFAKRLPFLCKQWASQRNATPFVILVMYWLKYFLVFIGVWAGFVATSADYPGFTAVGEWAFSDVAFQKAVLWAMLYESLGFGCSSGPMNGKFKPLIGGFLYFLRPGTTKLSLVPSWPVLGGITRSGFDVLLYAAHLVLLLRALVAPEITATLVWPIVLLLPILGLADKTLFLSARAEHYLTALVVLAVALAEGPWIAAMKMIWIFIWIWAAVSKFNHHFSSVIMVMMNNGPFFPGWLKKHLFASYPHDLRPSVFATWMAHFGAATEFALPFLFIVFGGDPVAAALICVVMTGFHGFIALNNPGGMPIEWNIMMIYGGWFLFFHHPEIPVFDLPAEAPVLFAFLLLPLVVIPTLGNFFPSRISFLPSMRYYAGNWAYNVWLFRGDAAKKLHRLTKASGTLREQLESIMDDAEAIEAASISSSTMRFLHLQGRVLFDAIPHAVEDVDDYEWMEGEVIAGMVLGWNFGDGHLHRESLLHAIQQQCGFEEGELRVVSVESQPLFGGYMDWRVTDAVRGRIAEGRTRIAPLRDLQPWPEGETARAFHSGSGAISPAIG